MRINRGIVISQTITPTRISGGVHPMTLRKFALYWDKMVYPVVNGVGPNLATLPDLDALFNEGVIELEPIALDPSSVLGPNYFETHDGVAFEDFGHLIAAAQAHVANIRNQSSSWIYDCARLTQMASMPSGTSPPTRLATALSFQDLLPTPLPETPMEKILKFKEKRGDELQHFREALESVKEHIEKSEDLDLAVKLSGERIANATRIVSRLLDEHSLPKRCETLRVYLNHPSSALVGAIGAGFAITQHLDPLVTGTAFAIGHAAINAALSLGSRLVDDLDRVPKDLKGFVYLHQIEEEFSVQGSR